MNKSDFVAELAAKAGISKADAQKAVNAFAEVLHEQAKKGEKIAIVGLGTFSVSERAARIGINPRTKAQIQIPASKSIKFKPSTALSL